MMMLIIRKIVLLLILRTIQCAVEDNNVITWNMQGACSNGENNWINIQQIMIHGTRIVALQEAGSERRLPTGQSLVLPTVTDPDLVFAPVTAYTWNIRTRFNPTYVYIYFLETDPWGNRVNLAIVTTRQADEVILLQPSNSFGRPILGIRHGNDYFFNIHAISGGGRDAPSLVNRTYQFMQTRSYISSWMIMGDFNRAPDTLMDALRSDYPSIANNVRTADQRQSTQRSGGNLDYAVVPTSNNRFSSAMLRDLNGYFAWSDHIPVLFPGGC